MKLSRTLAAGAIIISAPSLASTAAQPAGAITKQIAIQRADRLFSLLDTDHEGILTRDEARTAGMKLMADRLATGRDMAPGIGGHTLKFFEKRFASAQRINKRQFEQAMMVHFNQMDRNHDGILTPEEQQAGKDLADDR